LAPTWLTAVAWVYLSICFACAGAIGYDIAVNRRRQPMGVMNAVYPITALYFGPLALAFYWRWARAARRPAAAPASVSRESVPRPAMAPAGDGPRAHRGQPADHDMAGGHGADRAGEPTPPGKANRGKPYWATMATEVTFVLFPAPHQLMPDRGAFWLLMQIGMIIGFATSWPANAWLVKRGIKVPM
jgi:hypothetical protein